jgi:hypothetical protein
MTWEGFVSVVVAILTFGLSLAWPTHDMAPPTGTLTSTSFRPLTPTDRAEFERLMRLAGKCWVRPSPNAVPVRLRAEIDSAGRVLSTAVLMPEGPDLDRASLASIAAAEAALRNCQPYDLSPEPGGGWRVIIINFDAEFNPPPPPGVTVVPWKDPSPPPDFQRFSTTPPEDFNRFLPAPR